MTQKICIEKGKIQETLLLPLWGRAFETQKNAPRLIDNKAVEIIKMIEYDFSNIEKTQAMSQHGWVARSLHTDRMALKFVQEHPEATIVNIGCGLDTTFSRIDNGKIMFYELDLPDVITLRKNFYEDNDRHQSIASSFLDTEWFKEIAIRDGLLFLAGGVFYYFEEEQIKDFFVKSADYFGVCDFYFDSLSPMGMKIAKKQVLKKGGMGMSMDGGWGLKPVHSLEKWDKRIKVMDATPMSKGMKKGVPLPYKIISTITDMLGICSMVHVKIDSSL
ncbi:class I SAM-dependent methyltransferase [Dethiosulfatarculus sandiegensis]|uniref:Polyketide methyltransferase n=1 Tax=Dethiosulfatarculus sandiegensis TaxID=1429043 RepID=A0A0D2HZ51_9BACT|nr:class I SAM-dependent methyltransferase [Dethiosulfatarculus sandiegensis]KIX15503.1 polyketide methyltransferase [Dethiosulfatarculus sandiegensis]